MNLREGRVKAPTRHRDNLTAALFLLPAGSVLLVFGLFPIVYAVFISMHRWRLVREEFVGFANYVWAFTSPEMWRAVGVTVFYTLGTVPAALVCSFLLAALLFRTVRWRRFYRTVYFLPYVTSAVAAAMVWRWTFHPQWGFVNWFLQKCGMSPMKWLLEPRGVFYMAARALEIEMPGWAAGPSLALVVLMAFGVWHVLGFNVVVFLAGLATVPRELEDAARIDGASRWQALRYVTLPLLSPTILFLLIVSVIGSFQAFNHIYMLTGGGPLDTTRNLTLFVFANFYQYTRVGRGAAVAVILAALILGFTMVQMRVLSRRVHYQ